MSIYADMQSERSRQDAKWGIQRHKHGTWQLILSEEVGEVAQAALAEMFDKNRTEKQRGELRSELIQVAAVAVAWIEHIDENARKAKEGKA